MLNPIIIGKTNAIIVHFKLFVSFLIVKQVVPHGKWNKHNIKVHIAVSVVHPLSINKVFNDEISRVVNVDSDIYVIIIIGKTISFAGNPNINPIKITPSIPNTFANGFNVSDIYFSIDMSLI